MARPYDLNPLAEADRAEQGGDLMAATAALRRHLAAAPGDGAARLRYGRILIACGERGAARRELASLDALVPSPSPSPSPSSVPERAPSPSAEAAADNVAAEANRLLAGIDESDGALDDAADRWERLLADDVDDPQARAHLARLRPEEVQPPAEGATATLVSPEGVETLRYRIVRELGRGATSAVYLAREQVLNIPIALKVLHPQLAGPTRSEARRRFFAEARLAAALRHPGVIAIYDLDEKARTLSMEYVAGGTLRARLRRGDALTAAEIGAVTRSLLGALGYVHERAIAHGDLKPSNLLLRPDGSVVLADFGIAQLVGATGGPEPGGHPGGDDRPAGTPLYLAPEQFRGAPTSPATDLYAAGAILWELIAGRPMRQHQDLIANAPGGAPPLPHAAVAALGPLAVALGPLIDGLTDPSPARRLESVRNAVLD